MNSRERVRMAMQLRQPDRVPVMCQLSLGHYFLHAGLDPIDVWHSTAGFADALVCLQVRYGFDGILVNLPGRDPAWRKAMQRVETTAGGSTIFWKNGWYTEAPADDNPHVYQANGVRYFPMFQEIDPDLLYYVEPHDLSSITYPYSWGFEGEPAPPGKFFFPPWHCDTLREVKVRVGGEVSVHSEIFSPFSQFMELLNYTEALIALVEDPGKVKACLSALSEGAIALGCLQAAEGPDAILISSAFAGAGLISRHHYTEFVLPYEKKVIEGIKKRYDIPVYTHTCGAIGDRLDLLQATGTNGIDTLDPPPLGTVQLNEAKAEIGADLFIKGNLDPVNVLLQGTPESALAASLRCLEAAASGGGYILSSACSVAPATPPANILQLRQAVETFGRYP